MKNINQLIKLICLVVLVAGLVYGAHQTLLRVDTHLHIHAVEYCESISKYEEKDEQKQTTVSYPIKTEYTSCIKEMGY